MTSRSSASTSHTLSNVLGLTTVRQDVEAQGQVAADLLLGALLDDQPLDPSVMTYVPTELSSGTQWRRCA